MSPKNVATGPVEEVDLGLYHPNDRERVLDPTGEIRLLEREGIDQLIKEAELLRKRGSK